MVAIRPLARVLAVLVAVTAGCLALLPGPAHAATPVGVHCTYDSNPAHVCTPPLTYHAGSGGYVQHHPKVYLIFWGPSWSSDTTGNHQAVMNAVANEFSHLAGTAYNNILSQYTDASGVDGYVHNDVAYMGSYIDPSVPASGQTPIVGMGAVAAEVDYVTEGLRNGQPAGAAPEPAWETAWQGDNNDPTFIVFPQSGTAYDPVTLSSSVCGEHDNEIHYLTGNRNFAVVKFGDSPDCGSNTSQSGMVSSATTVASHEYAETATDPDGSEWTTNDPHGWFLSPPEIGDMCENSDPANGYFPSTNGTTDPQFVQYLWDNSSTAAKGGDCSSGRGTDYACAAAIHTVYGDMLADYAAFGGTSGGMGCPSEERAPFSGGARQRFSNGAIYQQTWSPDTGSRALYGPIYTDYAQNYEVGGSASIGWPLSNETTVALCNCDHEVVFQTGVIVSDGGSNTGWLNGDILSTWVNWGGPTGALGLPTGNQTGSGNGGNAHALFQNGTITEVNGAVQVSVNGKFVVGHARNAGNDYPYETIGQFEHQNEGVDAWNEYYGQCDSFAAWKVYENLAGTSNVSHPPAVPAPGWVPSNASVSPVNQNTWLNADEWTNRWSDRGYQVDSVPVPGAIAYWANTLTDPRDPNLKPDPNGLPGSNTGHVGYVTDVYPDGSITVEQYNMRVNGEYSVVHMASGQGYPDNSFGQGNYNVPWPTAFIHVADGPSGAASPAEPANGVVQAGYPTQVKVIGPGSSSAEFSTTDVWYNRAAHGEIGQEMYTHTNGPTAVSTATWTPAGLAGSTCYRVDALVPDNYSDNPTAIYTINDASGTSYAAVNENVQTNDWSELGVFKTNGSGGGLSVRLDDRGNTGLYVAADAMRFWRQPDCGQQGDASPVMMPSSYFGSWTTRSGHGFFGTEHYTPTTGTSTAVRNAMWTPSHLVAFGCYDVSVYVPDNFSDAPAASYWSNDSYYGQFYEQVDENAYTNQFTGVGTFQAWSDGTLPFELFDSGPSGDYVAADAVAFVLNPHCMAENGAANAFGSVPASNTLGPGSTPSTFSTTGDWSYYLGFGYANHQLFAPDNNGATATWTFTGAANACYTAQAYIPILGFADNPSAFYTFDTQVGAIGTAINQNTSNGWTSFAGNPKIPTGGDGKILVTLTSTGPSGDYTAADEISFVQTGC